MNFLARFIQLLFFDSVLYQSSYPTNGVDSLGEALMCSRFPVPPLFPGGYIPSLDTYLLLYSKTSLTPLEIAYEVDESIWARCFQEKGLLP